MTEPAGRTILHLDMDAFYASVEILDDPSLAGKPVVVGGSSRRGVVSAASYEARKFGVHSAMPTVQAHRLCPQAIFLPPRMRRYQEVSHDVFAIFHRYTPLVEGLSVDEAFLDVTGSRALFGEGPIIARRIKDDVRGELGLTVSAGVAESKFVAKVASDLGKPDGLLVVPIGGAAGFLAPLPVERMWGVGAKTAPKMRSLGFRTLGDLAKADAKRLEDLLGSWGAEMRSLARGEDARPVEPNREAKSVGAEETHEKDLLTRDDIERALLASCQRVAQRLLNEEIAGRTLSVKLKMADFTLLTRQTTLTEPAFDTTSLHRAACALLSKFPNPLPPVRLTGVSLSHLEPKGGAAPTLFPDQDRAKREKLEAAMQAIRRRFPEHASPTGSETVTRAALLDMDHAHHASRNRDRG